MADEKGLIVEGVVKEAFRGKFRIEMVQEGKEPDPDKPGDEILAHLAGKMRKHFIKIVPGDRVQVELSPYDMTRGRIIYRMKQ